MAQNGSTDLSDADRHRIIEDAQEQRRVARAEFEEARKRFFAARERLKALKGNGRR